jgi:hypothetical protein
VALKDVIKTEVRYVIAARIGTWSPKANKRVFNTLFAQKGEHDTRWWWQPWAKATVFASEKEARAKWRYLSKSEGWRDVRVVKVTLHPQIEQVYPTPNVVDAVGALAVGLDLEKVVS